MYPVSSHAERMASEDDVIPLRSPIVTKTGDNLNSIRVQKGQVLILIRLTGLNSSLIGYCFSRSSIFLLSQSTVTRKYGGQTDKFLTLIAGLSQEEFLILQA